MDCGLPTAWDICTIRRGSGPGLLTELFVDVRTLITAPQTAEYNILEAVLGGDPTAIENAVQAGGSRAVIRQLISDHEGLVTVADFQSPPVRRWPIKVFVQRVYQLRNTPTVADGIYITLTEGLAAPLITCDERLA